MEVYKGEECWTSGEAIDALYLDSASHLQRLVREGMPHIVLKAGRGGKILYPKERVHAWFRGDLEEENPVDKSDDLKMFAISWEKLNALMEAQGLCINSLSKKAKIPSLSTIIRIRNGKGKTMGSTTRKIANALGVKISDILKDGDV